MACSGVMTRAARNKRAGYEWKGRYVLHFLNACLKSDRENLSRLHARPVTRGVQLIVEARKAISAPPTEREFVRLILEEGTAGPVQVFRESKSIDPECVINSRSPHLLSPEGNRRVDPGGAPRRQVTGKRRHAS